MARHDRKPADDKKAARAERKLADKRRKLAQQIADLEMSQNNLRGRRQTRVTKKRQLQAKRASIGKPKGGTFSREYNDVLRELDSVEKDLRSINKTYDKQAQKLIKLKGQQAALG